MTRLHVTDALSVAELTAAALDGELYAVDQGWASIAEPEDPTLRAAAFTVAVGDPRLVAERLSAAWIWGARSRPPDRHTACVPPGRRAQGVHVRVTVRETDVRRREIRTLGRVGVTTPDRTLADLLRADTFGPTERDAVVRLAALVDPVQVRDGLAARPGLPHTRQALRRWRDVLG